MASAFTDRREQPVPLPELVEGSAQDREARHFDKLNDHASVSGFRLRWESQGVYI